MSEGIYKLPDLPNQLGYWFYLNMKNVVPVRKWCTKNLGRATKMQVNLSTGWTPINQEGKWSTLKDNRRQILGLKPYYFVFWTKESTTLFLLYHETYDLNFVNFSDYF